jgi:DNA polymerase sigma
MFTNVELVRDARIPIIRLIHFQYEIEIDISLNNLLVCVFCIVFIHYISFVIQALENTRLLKTYTQIDPRVPELGYMLKCFVKV